MPRYFAFLRAVNVGGRVVKMDALRAHFEELGFSDVETFIASGNVVFSCRSRKPQALQQKIEQQLQSKLGYEVDTFLRDDEQLGAVARHQPFTPAQLATAAALNIGFLDEKLNSQQLEKLMALRTDTDDFEAVDREIFWLARTRQSESKISNGVIEKALKTRATFRGVNTVKRLAEKYGLV